MELPLPENDEAEAPLEALPEVLLEALQFLTSVFFFFSGEIIPELELDDELLEPELDLDLALLLLLLLEDEDDRLLRLLTGVRFFISWELVPNEELTLERVEREVL
jgi:hypothetical protein